MDDILQLLDLEMNTKLRKALSSIAAFIHAETEEQSVKEIEKAISHLQEIRRGLLERPGLREK